MSDKEPKVRSFADLRREKELARQRDEDLLARGLMTATQIQQKNVLFRYPPGQDVTITYSNGRTMKIDRSHTKPKEDD